MNTDPNQNARLQILHSEVPAEPGQRFVQVRRWETDTGEHSELIVESGHVDEEGDLQTNCQVMPFYYDVDQALDELND